MEHSYEINPELTGISLAYFNKKYIADSVFKRVPVTTESFKYRRWDKGAALTVPNTLLGATGIPNSINAKAKLETPSVHQCRERHNKSKQCCNVRHMNICAYNTRTVNEISRQSCKYRSDIIRQALNLDRQQQHTQQRKHHIQKNLNQHRPLPPPFHRQETL